MSPLASLLSLAPPPAQSWFANGALTVLGTGAALPGPPVDTNTLYGLIAPHAPGLGASAMHAMADRMGMQTRHISRSFAARAEAPVPGARNPDLAAAALRAALDDAGLSPGDLGYLIGHTATPAQPLPSNVAHVADAIGFAGPHIELRQACTGFANALMIAFGLLARSDARPVAIVGSETGSLFFDPATAADDRGQLVNLVQMGDGAGAIILGPADQGAHRLCSAWFGATGLGKTPGIQMRSGGSDRAGGDTVLAFDQDFSTIAADGPALFAAGVAAAAHQGLSPHVVDHIIPHQASGRIGAQLAEALAVPLERVFVNADRVGNTGSAAIWIALAALRTQGMQSDATALVLGAEATKYMHGGFHYRHG